jgi:ferrous iron transport protein A
MELSDLKKDQKAVIKKINCNNELKQRFYSFGITKGAQIEVENVSLARNTIEINVENTSIGIRVEEAKAIEVEIL